MKRAVLRIGVVAATVAAATLTAASAAFAAVDAVASVSSGTLYFYDRDGTHNLNLVVRPVTASTVNVDANYKIVAMAGCTYPVASDNTIVKCSSVTSIYVYAGSGNDVVDIDPDATANIHHALFGEAGNDTLRGGPADGGLIGGDGDDSLNGRGGDDTVIGGAGADAMYGGTGTDLVDYMSHTSGVHASLDGVVGDDGAVGEGDTLGSDLEDIYATCYADVLIGNAAANDIWPLGGSDEVRGLAGSDYILDRDLSTCGGPSGLSPDIYDGGTGTDSVDYSHRPHGITIDLDNALGDDGAPGEGDSIIDIERVHATYHNDTLIGNDFDNVFYSYGGDDTVEARGGKDAVYADTGNDSIYGGAGTDYLYGGAGNDYLYAGPDGYYVDGGPDIDSCVMTDHLTNCELIF